MSFSLPVYTNIRTAVEGAPYLKSAARLYYSLSAS